MASEGVILPTGKSEVRRQDPKVLVIYGPPKVGKTTLLSMLPNNLIMDLEEGTEYVEAISMRIIGWSPPVGETAASVKARMATVDKNGDEQVPSYYITEAGTAIMKAGRPYDFITIDTVTELEDIIMPLAVSMYKSSPRQTWAS